MSRRTALGGLVLLLVGLLAASRVLLVDHGGAVVIDGQLVRTGPVPPLLVEFLYSPPGGMYFSLYALTTGVLAVAGIGYVRNGGVDDEVKAEALSNIVIVCSVGGTAAVLALVIPYWAAVPIGSLGGFVLGLVAQDWLGV